MVEIDTRKEHGRGRGHDGRISGRANFGTWCESVCILVCRHRKKPSAFLPAWISLTALAVLLVHVTGDPVQSGHLIREADEGADAHIWEILMAVELPILAFFAIKWLPRAPRQGLKVMALQAGAALANLAVVFFLGL